MYFDLKPRYEECLLRKLNGDALRGKGLNRDCPKAYRPVMHNLEGVQFCRHFRTMRLLLPQRSRHIAAFPPTLAIGASPRAP